MSREYRKGVCTRRTPDAMLRHDVLLGTDLDVALSDYSFDIVEPYDRQTQIVKLPLLSTPERMQMLVEHYGSADAVKRLGERRP